MSNFKQYNSVLIQFYSMHVSLCSKLFQSWGGIIILYITSLLHSSHLSSPGAEQTSMQMDSSWLQSCRPFWTGSDCSHLNLSMLLTSSLPGEMYAWHPATLVGSLPRPNALLLVACSLAWYSRFYVKIGLMLWLCGFIYYDGKTTGIQRERELVTGTYLLLHRCSQFDMFVISA